MMISDIVSANGSSNKISEFFEDFPVNDKKKKKKKKGIIPQTNRIS